MGMSTQRAVVSPEHATDKHLKFFKGLLKVCFRACQGQKAVCFIPRLDESLELRLEQLQGCCLHHEYLCCRGLGGWGRQRSLRCNATFATGF